MTNSTASELAYGATPAAEPACLAPPTTALAQGTSNTGDGVYGGSDGTGVYGHSNNGYGVRGQSTNGNGVYGYSQNVGKAMEALKD